MYNEYSKYYFRVKKVEGIKRFYFRFNNDNIEDSEETFRIYKRSQDRIQYNMRKQLDQLFIMRILMKLLFYLLKNTKIKIL